MSRAILVLDHPSKRRDAASWAAKAPAGTRVEFKGPKRTLPQNDRMWAMLTDIARQKTHFNMRLTADDWKLIFLSALKRELRAVPNLDGTGFVNLNQSSSDLSMSEMSDMIELMFAWGAQNGVTFKEPE